MDSKKSLQNREAQALAETIRQACVKAAVTAYDNARMDGLCHEGAWEMAVGALQQMDLSTFVQRVQLTASNENR